MKVYYLHIEIRRLIEILFKNTSYLLIMRIEVLILRNINLLTKDRPNDVGEVKQNGSRRPHK